ncbi:unnamed protein product, partial [Closterium sp. NIES-54]
AGVAIFDLDFDAILAAMYAMTISEEGDCYRCFPPDPGIGTSALGAGASALGASASVLSGAGETALSGTASASAPLTFTLDSGASRSFFRDRTTLTPLSRPVAVSLADPSGGPVLSRFSTVLPCPAAPSGTLSGLYLPSFSTNLVSGAALQDAGVHQFTPASQRVTHGTEASTGRHLATFTRTPGSSLYTLTTASPPVPESGRVPLSGQMFAAASRSGPESAPCSCRRLSHETLLWHHRLGHPSLPRLRGMASRFLVSGLPRSLPPLPQGPGPSCVPCVEGRQRAAPHSSQFPPTEAPLQTLHMDVWGPARVRGLGHECYFLLVVDDFSRYTTVFPLRSKGDVTEVLIDWIRAARLQLRQSFGSDFPVLRLHSDRGGEFSSGLLRAFCRARGIRQTFTLSDSPQQNGIAERCIGMVMDVARTSMMHAAAPHFLWPFAVRYAAHQINLHPRVSSPETSPALLWTGKVGNASAFRVWGSRVFVRDLSADKLSPRTAPCRAARTSCVLLLLALVSALPQNAASIAASMPPGAATPLEQQAERAALLAFWEAMGRSEGLRASGWGNASLPCDPRRPPWGGVHCSPTGHVDGIELGYNQLSGPLPSTLGLLSSLQALRIPFSNITGSLPASLSRLSALSSLRLTQNLLAGPLPANFSALTALTELAVVRARARACGCVCGCVCVCACVCVCVHVCVCVCMCVCVCVCMCVCVSAGASLTLFASLPKVSVNSLSGSLPASWSKLSRATGTPPRDIGLNYFNGSVPPALDQPGFTFVDNCFNETGSINQKQQNSSTCNTFYNLLYPPPPPGPPIQEVVTMSSSSFPIAAVVVPVVVVVLVLLLAVFLWRRWHSERLARMLRKEIG